MHWTLDPDNDGLPSPTDPLRYRERWRVRGNEIDSQGHVNNQVYLGWAEEIAIRHSEAAGYGRRWTLEKGGAWVVRKAEITYHRPAVYGDLVEVEVVVERLEGARGWRRTWVRRYPDGELLAEVAAQWVWVRISDGRPARVPVELIELGRRAGL